MPDAAYYYLPCDQAITLAQSLEELTTIELYKPNQKLFWNNYLQQNARKLQ